MAVTEVQVRNLITRFKSSIAADLYSSTDIVDFDAALAAVSKHEAEISALDALLTEGPLESQALAHALISSPRLYALLCSLLAITTAIELEDGRTLPPPTNPPTTLQQAQTVATILVELGLAQLLSDHVDVSKLLLVGEIEADAARRRFRVDAKIKQRVTAAVNSAIRQANTDGNWSLALGDHAMVPTMARRIVEHVVTIDGTPRIAVASTFQTHSGGRQAREMRTLYPGIQTALAGSGMSLVLLADGRGMRALSDSVLLELFRSVPHTMSLAQAENGELKEAFLAMAIPPPRPDVDSAGLRQLIQSALSSRISVVAPSLPINESTARLALASYASANDHLALTLSADGTALSWERASLVDAFRRLRVAYDGSQTVQHFAELLQAASLSDIVPFLNFRAAVVTLRDDPVFRSPFLVAATPNNADVQAVRELAKHALETTPESRVAVVITYERLTPSTLSELRGVQSALPVTTVALDLDTCISLTQLKEAPRDRVRMTLLEQTDLTKLSPFVVRGVTPARIFFGREEEEATLLSTLPTNSVALVGARRIGKTSLMLHSFARLEAANLRPFFGDCQVVRNWTDFGEMASRNWDVELPVDFKPQHLFDLVNKLHHPSAGPIVLLLDEIDQLLDWDKAHTEDEVPEAFFRACRSISQQGIAQFVFSGERTIADRMWDASSPHWNFCRPLMLQQLTAAAAASLMAEPLESLGVRIEDRDLFVAACWDTTNGHPELLQFLGDRIVNLLNQRDRIDVYTAPEDVFRITEQFEYAEQYLETYWGQATPLERILSILLIEGPKTIEQMAKALSSLGLSSNLNDLRPALHMLELYGIAEQSDAAYQLRALWFTTALRFYGGPEMAIRRYTQSLQR